MKRPLLRRLLDKLRRRKPAPPPAPEKPEPRRRPTHSSAEPLEGRIAPAILLNPMTVQYKDADGDLVTVKFSKPIFAGTGGGLVNAALKFDTGTTSATGSLDIAQELQMIDLTVFAFPGTPSPAEGVGITVTAVKQNGVGDDFAKVGYIRAAATSVTGLTLGAITIDGDLGQIDAGDFQKATAVASLTVQTFGAAGLASQAAGGSLVSDIVGRLGKLVVKGDFVDAQLKVANGSPSSSPGKIGSITIGGSLRVSDGSTTKDAGQISAASDIGTVKVGTTSSHGIFGGGGEGSGKIIAGGRLSSVLVTGDLRGGAGKDSGQIIGTGAIGSVTLGVNFWAGTGENAGRISTSGNLGVVKMVSLHGETTIDGGLAGKNAATIFATGNLTLLNVAENMSGGKGEGSGSVTVNGVLSTMNIGRGLTGGEGKSSGRVLGGVIGSVSIGNALTGAAGDDSGSVFATANIGKLTVKNLGVAAAAVVAGTGTASGSVSAGGNIGPIFLGGALDGSTASAKDNAGSIRAGGNMGSVTIKGALKGGGTELNGALSADGAMGAVSITGDMLGGAGVGSAAIIAGGRIASVKVTGALDGGLGARSAAIISGNDLAKPGDLGNVEVRGIVAGDAGIESASIIAGGKIQKATLGIASTTIIDALRGGAGGNSGSLIALKGIVNATIHGSVIGADGANSGTVQASGAITTLKINGALTGGTGDGSGGIAARDIIDGFTLTPGDLGTITIKGALTSAAGIGSGVIFADGSVKALTVGALNGPQGAAILIGQGQAAFADDFVKIGGAGSITTGAISAGSVIDAGGRIGALIVKGTITDATITTGRDLGALTIGGAVSDSLISAQIAVKTTKTTNLTIGKITVTGDVTNTNILAGYDRFGGAVNGDAQIGTVLINGNWMASSLVAGAEDSTADGFGQNDTLIPGGSTDIIAKIASLTVTGAVTGTPGGTDFFGFVAQQIVFAKLNNAVQPLTAATQTIPLSPATSDVAIHEVA